ncbi:hypothetical protein, partial [Pseudoxanthomonas taiwanensis]|uniref:hypothetical protein n=1 Tax=Pseudoxanthomonas taiwanensis TaxID=176598 RepID=UPI001C9AB775
AASCACSEFEHAARARPRARAISSLLMLMLDIPRRLVGQRAIARRQHDDKAVSAVKQQQVSFVKSS